jgi:hypothetical protein
MEIVCRLTADYGNRFLHAWFKREVNACRGVWKAAR